MPLLKRLAPWSKENNRASDPSYNISSEIIKTERWILAVAKLVERWLPTPVDRGSNPVIGKIYIEHLFTVLSNVNWIKKTKIKKNEAGNGPFRRTLSWCA